MDEEGIWDDARRRQAGERWRAWTLGRLVISFSIKCGALMGGQGAIINDDTLYSFQCLVDIRNRLYGVDVLPEISVTKALLTLLIAAALINGLHRRADKLGRYGCGYVFGTGYG